MKKFEPLSQKLAEIMRSKLLSQMEILARLRRKNVHKLLNLGAMGLIFSSGSRTQYTGLCPMYVTSASQAL